MTDETQKPKESTIQVVDKRRFDHQGQERSGEVGDQKQTEDGVSATARSSGQTAAEATQSGAFTMSENSAGEEPVAFTSFIMSLATQVLVQLGEMPPPEGMQIPLDLEAARQTIDIMAMLQRRTKGNLSQEESRFMEEVLHSLRISFINTKKKTSQSER
jgi:hypothetical protein